jgi:hypothetical protein
LSSWSGFVSGGSKSSSSSRRGGRRQGVARRSFERLALRSSLFEALEQRQLLTAVSIDSFSADSTTNNLVVNYSISGGRLVSPFDVQLLGNHASTPLMTQAVTPPEGGLTGSHSITFTGAISSVESLLDTALTVTTNSPDATTTSQSFSGAFEDSNGLIEVQDTSNGDTITTSVNDTSFTVGLQSSGATYTFSNTITDNPSGIHVRAQGTTATVSLDPALQTPQWLIGGDGNASLIINGTTKKNENFSADITSSAVTLDNNSNARISYSGVKLLSAADGGEGNDSFSVHEPDSGTLPNISISGPSSNGNSNPNSIFNPYSALTIYGSSKNDSAIVSNNVVTFNGKTIAYSNIDSLAVDGGSAGSDLLTVASSATGSIIDNFNATTNTAAFAVGSLRFKATGFLRFNFTTNTLSLTNISLSQTFNVTGIAPSGNISANNPVKSDITLAGAITVPSGFTPFSNPRLLIRNWSSATLHGGFTNGNRSGTPATPITIASTDYYVDYTNDVLLDSESYSGSVQVTTTQILTPDDAIPRFVTGWSAQGSSNINKSIAGGAWSNASIWSLGHVPVDGELVKISARTFVSYGSVDSTDHIKALEIDGTLAFATNVNTQLIVGTTEVLPGGALLIGTSSTPVASNVTASFTIANQALDTSGIDPKQYGTGLIAYGTVSIHGSPVGAFDPTNPASTTWLNLAQEVSARATSLVLTSAVPSGWAAGDQIVVPDTRQALSSWDWRLVPNSPNPVASQTEVRTIDHISSDGKTVYLTVGLTYAHLGGHNTSGGLETLPQIALLDRNVTIASESPTGTRGHTFYGGRANVDIEYTKFLNLGRTDAMVALDNTNGAHIGTNQIGRYAVHFHHLEGPINPTNTGYQFEFVGNTVQASKKWAVAVHNSSYGLLGDNVVFDAQGAGFVTEDGSEIGNAFLNNMTVYMHGTYLDGNAGIDKKGNAANNDFGRGGVGFWFRRSGNDVEGNVSADDTYAGMVITSYYDFLTAPLPDFRGADVHIAGQYTDTYLNPAGTFANDTIYGMGLFGIWAAYITGDDFLPNQPNVVFDHFTLWNAAENAVLYAYHTDALTIDHSLLLGDKSALDRTDWGAVGVTLAKYESLNTVIDHSRIEGMYTGIVSPALSDSPPGVVRTPTIIRNSTLIDYVGVDVVPATTGFENGNAMELDNDLLTTFTLAGQLHDPYTINMDFAGSGDPRDLTKYSLVNVTSYNRVLGADFQVYYKEQAAGAIMLPSDPTYFSREVASQIGARVGSYMTNQQAWGLYGIATGGFIAPSNANSTTHPEINGLTSTTTVDPATMTPKVVLVTPGNGTSFISQIDTDGPYILIRYNVQGLVDASAGQQIQFSLSNGTSTTTYSMGRSATLAMEGITDSLIENFYENGTWHFLVPGHYTLRGYIVDSSNNAISGTATQVSFNIVSQHVSNVSLTPVPKSATAGYGIMVGALLTQAGAQVDDWRLNGKGLAITSTSTTSGQGNWQYFDYRSQHYGWYDIPPISTTGAFVLPPTSRLRFKVGANYQNAGSDPSPTLVFYMYDRSDPAKDYTANLDVTSSGAYVSSVSITVRQPLLAS